MIPSHGGEPIEPRPDQNPDARAAKRDHRKDLRHPPTPVVDLQEGDNKQACKQMWPDH